jgi:hypothetical protein
VDVTEAGYINTIGDPSLTAHWVDPDFDPSQRAFYYVRVLEIPRPSWQAYDSKYFGVEMPDEVPMTIQGRALPRRSGTRREAYPDESSEEENHAEKKDESHPGRRRPAPVLGRPAAGDVYFVRIDCAAGELGQRMVPAGLGAISLGFECCRQSPPACSACRSPSFKGDCPMRKNASECGFWLIAAALLISLAAPALGETPEHHAMVRFWIETPADQEWMDDNHLRFQLEGGIKGEYYDFLVKPAELPGVLAAGNRVEVRHENVEEFYASRLGLSARDLWGAYHTYSEMVAWVDSLTLLYPNVVSAKWSIGLSLEGNDLWAFRMSDNPGTDEDEPEICFDGLHHANEIMGLEVTVMLAEYLAERYYAGDPEIVDLVNEREIYFVPAVNPDGLLYNEAVYPGGGATWRKNRRDNGNGTWGVDLNRNYDYEWGCSWGSSGNPGDPTYRGTAPESEPEIEMLAAFVDSREFVIRQSYHSSGRQTLIPWSYTSDPTPDGDLYREMAPPMVQFNNYEYGQPGHVLYDVCGGALDWDYGATDRHTKIFGYSNELGTSQWPPLNQRQPIFDYNLWPALYLIQMAGYLRGVSWDHMPLAYPGVPGAPHFVTGVPTGYDGAAIDPGSVTLHYRVDGGAISDLPMTPTGNPGEFGASIPGQALGAEVEYYLSASDLAGNDGSSPLTAPAALHYFEVGPEIEHPMEADRGWTSFDGADDGSTGLWVRVDPIGTAAQPEDDHSAAGTHCWVTGQHEAGQSLGYSDVDKGRVTLYSPVYDMTGAQSVTFGYWRWYSNDQGSAPGDWWDVELSNDGGQTWTSIEHTQTSSNAWVSQSFVLADYYAIPGLVQLRFIAADEGSGSIVEGAVDDFSIAGVFETTRVGDLPTGFELAMTQNYPNPFNPKTTIRFQLPSAGPVHLGIYDAAGRLIQTLASGEVDAGNYGVSWNGRDALGRPVAGGVYFARLVTPAGELNQRMVLLK